MRLREQRSILDNGIVTVFELFHSELLKELLRQLGHEVSVQFLSAIKNISSSTRN